MSEYGLWLAKTHVKHDLERGAVFCRRTQGQSLLT